MIAVGSRALGLRQATLAQLRGAAHAAGFAALGVGGSPRVTGAGAPEGGAGRVKISALRAGCLDARGGAKPPSEELGSLDAARGEAAVKSILAHASLAASAACSLVVVDAGDVEAPGLDERYRHAEGLAGRGEGFDELLDEIRRIAAPRRDAHLERLCRRVHEIVKGAAGAAVALAPASRPHGILTVAALGDVLAELKGLPVGVWIDVGRAAARERVGGEALTVLLPAVASRVLGLDVHDCDGLREHLTPGEGSIDWKLVAENAPRGAVRVLDVEPASAEALRLAARAAEHLLTP
jgi:sugar phosphate isomerase/epimerase